MSAAPSALAFPHTPVARSLRMYNSLVERCFKDCVESFRRKDLDATEEKVRGATLPACLQAGSLPACLHAGLRSSKEPAC